MSYFEVCTNVKFVDVAVLLSELRQLHARVRRLPTYSTFQELLAGERVSLHMDYRYVHALHS